MYLEDELLKREASFSTSRNINVLLCTWNIDSAKPESLSGTPENVSFLDSCLRSVDTPDVLVFGFQEVIDLESKKLTASMSLNFGLPFITYFTDLIHPL